MLRNSILIKFFSLTQHGFGCLLMINPGVFMTGTLLTIEDTIVNEMDVVQVLKKLILK